MKIYEGLYYFLNYIIYILYFLTWFNIWAQAPQYLHIMQYFFQILIGFILVIFFNPIYSIKLEEVHYKVAFSAGTFLLTSTLFNIIYSLFYSYFQRLNNKMREITNKIIFRK